MEPFILDPATLEDEEDPFRFLLDDRNGTASIEDTLAAALLRLNEPKCDVDESSPRRSAADPRRYRHDELHDNPLLAFDDLPAAPSSSAVYPLAYDCYGDCSFDTTCTLPECTLDSDPSQVVCCSDSCQDGLTVTCSERDCEAPNRCDEVCGTCNNTSCQAEPCADPGCPVSFSHFDVCFEAACAPSPGSGACSPAPCELSNCDGTFVMNSCGDTTHQGWDPNCPGSLVRPQDVVHEYDGMPPPSATNGSAVFQAQSISQQHGHYLEWLPYTNDHEQQDASLIRSTHNADSASSQTMSNPSSSPATSIATVYDQTQWVNLDARQSGLFPVRNQRLDCCQPSKRQRLESNASRETSISVTSVGEGQRKTLTSSNRAAIPLSPPEETVCRWITNPQDPFKAQHECGFVAKAAKDLHEHLLRAHTSQLNSNTRFHCHWAGCPRMLTADYGQKSKLNRHLLTHSNFLPYPCSHPGCSKAFSTNDQRRNHEATHTDERKYCCDWPGCGAKFRHATSLSTHRYTHTGEKPYVCWICGHREGDPSNKSKHMKKEHPDLPRQRPGNWDEETTRREVEARGYSWPPGGCKLNDGCDK